MKNARAGFRRSQFRLWIFSYTILPWSSKKRLSRLMIGDLYTRHAARLIRQERLDGGLFIVGEFTTHDSRLRFGGLNHDLAAELNFRFGGRYGT
jgi:hypothetical protein